MKNNQTVKTAIIVASLAIIILVVGYISPAKSSPVKSVQSVQSSALNTLSAGIDTELPARWGNLGKQLVENGVIDAKKFEEIYAARGGLKEYEKNLLYGEDNGNLVINKENAGVILNLLWALGLANENEILTEGPMSDPSYGGAGGFASTGGWTLAKGDVMTHYSKHRLVVLTVEQQALVEKTAKNIFRPCCGNSTYFPDCNHGMAMLALLELMARDVASEEEMYNYALAVNSLWFPDTYGAIDKYLAKKGQTAADVGAKEILGENYSSAGGYGRVLKELGPQSGGGGGSCGV